ncbi:chromate transporter [Clostridium formicaceticum]|uniref:Chromate transport protein n=1 Tax=Clostridium formicaceticum TaxID=1497 RepID=A0AAC9RP66_9CLOT|nr:chromate transporter [Clostridium formicaceticum]AOY74872.1 chromate transporter [Clostridium formicaceticum]ARE89274.1 putative chromate transport protein [Clostridium formicaceticum]
MIYIHLFFEFFKIGMFSIGGGLATLPFLYQMVDKYSWITSEDLLNMIAVAESTPGPIGINTATFVGYKAGSLLGGIVATMGIITPAIVIISLIVHYFMKFNENPIVRAGFNGIRPAVVGLIGAAGFEVARVTLFDPQHYTTTHNFLYLLDYKAILLFTVMLFAMNKYKKHPILYIVASAIIGIVFKY